MEDVKKRSDCPISCSLDILGDKWSLLIVRDLLWKGVCTYGDLAKSPEGIATNILAGRLRKLEENGLVSRSASPENKLKVLYRLTPKGIGLFPVIVEYTLWAAKYLDLPLEDNPIVKGVAAQGKEAYIRSVMSVLETR